MNPENFCGKKNKRHKKKLPVSSLSSSFNPLLKPFKKGILEPNEYPVFSGVYGFDS